MTLAYTRCGSPVEHYFFEIVPRHAIAFWYDTAASEKTIQRPCREGERKERERGREGVRMKGKGRVVKRSY